MGVPVEKIEGVMCHIGTLHCTGRSDSRNAYSVADDPSSRGPVNPRISFYISKFFIGYTLP